VKQQLAGEHQQQEQMARQQALDQAAADYRPLLETAVKALSDMLEAFSREQVDYATLKAAHDPALAAYLAAIALADSAVATYQFERQMSGWTATYANSDAIQAFAKFPPPTLPAYALMRWIADSPDRAAKRWRIGFFVMLLGLLPHHEDPGLRRTVRWHAISGRAILQRSRVLRHEQPMTTTARPCQALTRSGQPCRCYAVHDGDGFCFTHDPRLAAQRAESRRRGGHARHGRRVTRSDTPPPQVRTIDDVLVVLNAGLADLWTLENSIARVRTLTALDTHSEHSSANLRLGLRR
jgi:hypothetical protein